MGLLEPCYAFGMDIIPEQSNTAPVSTTPPTPSSNKTWPFAAGAVVLILLIAGGMFVYWYTNQTTQKELAISEDSVSWKTYSNVQFAYELTYPGTWRVIEETGNMVTLRNYNTLLDAPTDQIIMYIRYKKDDNPEQVSLDEWLKIDSHDVYVSDAKSQQKINIGDEALKIVQADYTSSSDLQTVSYLIRREKNIIYIHSLAKNKDIYITDQIVSSIKFTAFDKDTYDEIVKNEYDAVIGADANKDGVWDYVEQWIDTKYSGNMRTALRLLAKEIQFSILNYRNQELIVEHAQKGTAVSCIYRAAKADEASGLGSELRAVVLNTEARANASRAADSQLVGGIINFPTGEEAMAYCGF